MFFTLESKPRHSNCPYCQSKKTFISIHPNPMGKRFCINCGQNYDRSDELRLAQEKKAKITNFEKKSELTPVSKT